MPKSSADRNLLFGILALQMDFISRDALVAAMHAWVLDKDKSLGQILQEQGPLCADNRALLDALVQRHLEMHANDPRQSLAALPVAQPALTPLGQFADADVQTSLANLTPGTPTNEADVTGPYQPAKALPPNARFRILRPHSRGGLGEVSVARDEELGREVALKEIQERHAGQPESRARFLLEARITGRLEHPGIVPVYGLGTYADGRPFYAMRFIQGGSLKEAIEHFHRERATLPAGERTLRLRHLLGRFVDVCNAVAYAHSRGVLHRDLKPANVMLGKYGETLVVDWGLAKVLGQAEAEATEGVLAGSGDQALTQAGQTLGTPAYMSPEQAAGRLDQVGPRSDVYSLGATLYCLLTGQAPFVEGDVGTLLGRVRRGDFPRPRQLETKLPAALETICLKAMVLQPENRYATPRALADDVERWLADEPTTVWREPWTQRLGRWVRRNRTKVTAAAALLLTATVGLGIGTLLLGLEQGKTARALEQESAARQRETEARQQEDQARGERALAQVDQLRTAEAAAVPGILDNLAPSRADVLPRLRLLWAAPDRSVRQRQERMRVGLGLLVSEPQTVKETLLAWMLDTDDPRELELTRDLLAPSAPEFAGRLWARADDRTTPAAVRFRPGGAGPLRPRQPTLAHDSGAAAGAVAALRADLSRRADASPASGAATPDSAPDSGGRRAPGGAGRPPLRGSLAADRLCRGPAGDAGQGAGRMRRTAVPLAVAEGSSPG